MRTEYPSSMALRASIGILVASCTISRVNPLASRVFFKMDGFLLWLSIGGNIPCFLIFRTVLSVFAYGAFQQPLFTVNEYFPGLTARIGTNDTLLFHHVHQARGPAVAEPQ